MRIADTEMTIHTHAHARAGLIGNPSDGYFGKTISIILRNFTANVTCRESARLTIVPQACDRLEFDNIDDLNRDVRAHGYYGGIRLIKAAIRRFTEYCREQGISLPGRNFTIAYDTDIPVRIGLAGSSAIITAVFRALMRFFDVAIADSILPNLILSVERDELHIGAGLQDRVIQVYEGTVYMDFDRALMERDGHGAYEALDPAKLPPLFVAYHEHLAEGTEITHNDLRDRFDRGEREVVDAMHQFADLARRARELIIADRGAEIGPLMDANFDLRARLCPISEGNRRLVEIGRRLGAAVKFAGSGGAIVGAYDGDPDRLDSLTGAYTDFGASLIVPIIAAPSPAASPHSS
jgi:glucuronokinase